jgi:hypothetical protein
MTRVTGVGVDVMAGDTPIMDARELVQRMRSGHIHIAVNAWAGTPLKIEWNLLDDEVTALIKSRDATIRAQERERVIEECKTILEIWHNHDGDRLKQLAQVVAIEKSIHKEPKE